MGCVDTTGQIPWRAAPRVAPGQGEPDIEKFSEERLHRHAAVRVGAAAGSEDRILVHRRSEQLSRFPGLYEVMVGGAVNLGEAYAQAAAQELAEELGIRALPRLLFTFINRRHAEGRQTPPRPAGHPAGKKDARWSLAHPPNEPARRPVSAATVSVTPAFAPTR